MDRIVIPSGTRLASITIMGEEEQTESGDTSRQTEVKQNMSMKEQLEQLQALYGAGDEADSQMTELLREAWLGDAEARSEFSSFETFCGFHKGTLTHNVRISGGGVAR